MNSFYAFSLGTLFTVAFALYFLFAYQYGLHANKTNALHILSDPMNKRIFFSFAVAGFFLCLYLILQNRFVYFWDYGGYWTASYTTKDALFRQPIETLKLVYRSILDWNYNHILPLLISVPLKCFGYTFPRYVMLNYLLFLVPVWLITISIIWKQFSFYRPELNSSKSRYVLFTLITLGVSTFPPYYRAMLLGYIDIACIIPALLAILLFMDYDCLSLNKKQILRDILIASLLLTAFLFRRYFAYFGVGYAIALSLYSIYKIFKDNKQISLHKRMFRSLGNLFIIGAFSILTMLLFFRRLVIKTLSTNYAGQYEAYDAPLLPKIESVVTQLGPITITLIVIAIIFAFLSPKARKLTSFCACTFFFTTISFFHVQSMGAQHIYTIAGEACILMILGIDQIINHIRNNRCKCMAAFSFSAIVTFGAVYCFFPTVRQHMPFLSNIYSQTYSPLQRNDLHQLHELAHFLNSLTDHTNKHVYVCASGGVLNSSIMDSLDKPHRNGALHHMYWTADVDLRDGFNPDFLRADYIIITDPIQLHLKKGTQEVVRFPWAEVQNQNSPIGRHFSKMQQSFALDCHVTAYIYEKTSDFELSDYEYLADYYNHYYPGMNQLFSDRILKMAKHP